MKLEGEKKIDLVLKDRLKPDLLSTKDDPRKGSVVSRSRTKVKGRAMEESLAKSR